SEISRFRCVSFGICRPYRLRDSSSASRVTTKFLRSLRARRERPRRRRTAEHRDEIAPFQLVKWHSVARQLGPNTKLSNWGGSVSRYGGFFNSWRLLLWNECLARRSNTGDLNDHLTVLRSRVVGRLWRLGVEGARRICLELAFIPLLARSELERARYDNDPCAPHRGARAAYLSSRQRTLLA